MRSFMKYFRLEEFRCRCGREHDVFSWNIFEMELLYRLEALRDRLGKPIVINRAYSCWDHHLEIYEKLKKPATKKSGHLLLDNRNVAAVDIYGPALSVRDLATNGANIGFTGIGIGDKYVHLDVLPRRSWWVYRPGGVIDYIFGASI